MRRSRLLQFITLVAAACAALLGLTGQSAPARADTTMVSHVFNTGGEGLWEHPDNTALTGTLSDLMADGTEFDISCWTIGDNVNGDSVWEQGVNVATGNPGWTSDYYLDTPTTAGNEGAELTSAGVPECGSGTAASGAQDTTSPSQTSPPASDLAVPAPSAQPEPPQSHSGILPPPSYYAIEAACATFAQIGESVSYSMCEHYAQSDSSDYGIDMGNLVWTERPLWASIEWQLHNQVSQSLASLLATPSDSGQSQPFDTNWLSYTATQGDWHDSLHAFQYRVIGDVWVGPADESGNRPIQVRYRSAMFDVYDFDPTSKLAMFKGLADGGWATEFTVTGNTATQTLTGSSNSFDPNSIGFRW